MKLFIRIKENEIGIVNKKISTTKKRDSSNSIISMNGQSGWQVDYLNTGIHFLVPGIYEVEKVPLTRIPAGEIGLVIAHDGKRLETGQILGKEVECNYYENPRQFIENGGQRGKQLGILPTGIYRIHTKLFSVITSKNAENFSLNPKHLKELIIQSGNIGIVTTLIGKTLPKEDIAAPIIEGHENFQDPQSFISQGGFKGLQEETLSEGIWMINPWFAKVDQVPLTNIRTGTVGVVLSSVGKNKPDTQTENRRIVPNGDRGIWKVPLKEGYHDINTRVHRVIIVPTHQIELKWNKDDKPNSNYDAKLKALKLHSKDGYDFEVELTQKFQINSGKAPLMIQKLFSEGKDSEYDESIGSKYASIQSLISRAVEPLISAHFRMAAQQRKVIEFQENLSDIQLEAETYIKSGLENFGVEAVGTHINEVDLPDELTKHMRAQAETKEERKLLEEKTLNAEKNLELARMEAEADKVKADADAYADNVKTKSLVEAYGGIEAFMKLKMIEQLPGIKVPNFSVNSESGKNIMSGLMAVLFGNQIANPDLSIKLQELLEGENPDEKKTRLIELISSSNAKPEQVQEFFKQLKKLGKGEEENGAEQSAERQ